ncbi:23S rRNA (uracil(1939)-C(5))-methyltransferase RlmD [Listeria newyorkensis]|uniref:23S rRNA (uracil(1939)-C(5))-methyltransferase RlmD n=1 Tax=Listeria newyorkensis TaxID=1497681 RepID=UPI00051E12F6|nr:23S rRNA (uracil(1939)-C(5))-methyltransferase RlmD [Listeria newyorkensis]KGL43417.1 RNA methyltransferase [Listeria newyorkensis]KGL46198.1 RNA methyltransferase [Listeriaceae bacterium FSL A5-0209]SQC55301.1 23S rRNA (uracil-C(5))-methyltransferase RlmCD [Listeria newyorkensis]
MSENPVTEGQQFPLTIKRIGINGEGIGYFKRSVVFVTGALAGEEVVVEATKVNPRYTEAKIRKIRKKSPHRVTPPCPVYDACGGCQLQHLSYPEQLKMKKDLIVQSIEKHTRFHLEQIKIRDTIGMGNPWGYRNKSQFQVREIDDVVEAGLFSAESHELVPIENCVVQHPDTVKVTNFVRDLLEELEIPIYEEQRNSGIVRTIVVRTGIKTGEIQLVLVTNSKKLPRKRELLERIQTAFPEIVSIMQNVNQAKTSLIFGEETLFLAGEEKITEKLGEIEFDLSARAFFQLNPSQTEKLYREVARAIRLTGNEKIVDAYCGVGTIGLSLAKRAAEVRGMDTIAESIEDAKANAERAGITNVSFETGKAEEVFPKWIKAGFKPDAIVVDPPRVGCEDQLLQSILRTNAKQIVYVSCNPSTLARDIQILSKKYNVKYIQPLDMFPHTAHVESITVLTLKN